MTNSEQIKEAPIQSADTEQILRNFRDATVALLNCDAKPKGVDDAIDAMLDDFNNELGGADEDRAVNAHRVMSRVFGLNDDDGSPAPGPVVHREIRAEEFTLVDRDGTYRARLQIAGGDTVLTMRDSKGRPRLRIRAGDNEAMITICGERGKWGRGVLAATDEAERIRIGYDTADQDPRVVIQDGNERECVSAEIGDGEREAPDGFIRLTNPADGSHALIDSEGLIALDGKREPLPEYTDRPTATQKKEPEPATLGATVPSGADDNWRARLLSDEAAAELAAKLFGGADPYSEDADQVAGVVIRIADLLAYEDDRHVRESAFHAISRAFYQRTRSGDEALTRFAKAAGATFGGA